MSVGVGSAIGALLVYLNNKQTHSFIAVRRSSSLLFSPGNFKAIYQRIYEHLNDQYEERGQLEAGEEILTVKPNVFAQIGVIDFDGVRKMWTSHIVPQLRRCVTGDHLANTTDNSVVSIEKALFFVIESAVFCDIGSGVGNVCLQLLAETNCRKVVGVEVIPSRHRAATTAFAKALSYFPENFSGKQAIFIQDDFVNCARRMVEENVNVIFTHSWMFDDELMKRLTELVVSLPALLCVVTSRPLHENLLVGSQMKLVSYVHLTADWNDEAPFFIYRKIT
ncbi:hypothetical protein, conserved [Trypanosoma brucei gambiense DAL972]|uniref:Histone-lysine N-methyltransferase, H3 lysine-79 specific n=1 Tax=Trypanosoma brucei gambiense (strain MHOM/CI/86/DAL972) TaxID=679716 RepID=D0A6D6_TRYB9|nr:LOW QUALITY PROTEIN: hypothetical protein, conserved [Trypanosoma brucei gambiense DAL972]CBH17237.1 hypothetical protein, conserved [Trypanosoma brucei gambiense DAL972]|eukprot:XP_011779501.1 LOW QUALITY PROTEIN: hypothetical protein, conserved [Trypanosoma brucei gambiense DAL972]